MLRYRIMAPDLSGLDSTPRRPRAATSVLPAMVTPSYAARQGPNATSPIQHSGSPPLGSSEYGITSTAQGKLDRHLLLLSIDIWRLTRVPMITRATTASQTPHPIGSPYGIGEGAGGDGEFQLQLKRQVTKFLIQPSGLGESVDPRTFPPSKTDHIHSIDSFLHLQFQ
jgi:hypothetical protein